MFFRQGPNSARFSPFVGAFGKIPSTGDFVRISPRTEPTVTLFEHWLVSAVEWIETRPTAPAADVRAAAPALGFVFRPRPRTGGMLVGALRWSQDAVGRSFPFALFAAVSDEALGATQHLIPLATRSFVEHVGARLGAVSVESADDLRSWLASFGPPVLEPPAPNAQSPYAAWCAHMQLGHVWSLFYGSPGASGAHYAIHTLAEALAPFRNNEEPSTRLGVRLPLSGGHHVHWAFGAAFWMDVTRRVAGWKANTPTCFWTMASSWSRLLVALGEPHPSALAEATLGRGDPDQICELSNAEGGSTSGYRPLPAPLSAMFANPTRTVSDLLAALTV